MEFSIALKLRNTKITWLEKPCEQQLSYQKSLSVLFNTHTCM